MWFEVTIYTMYCKLFPFNIWPTFSIRLNARIYRLKKNIFPMLKAKRMIYNEALQYMVFLRAIKKFPYCIFHVKVFVLHFK